MAIGLWFQKTDALSQLIATDFLPFLCAFHGTSGSAAVSLLPRVAIMHKFLNGITNVWLMFIKLPLR